MTNIELQKELSKHPDDLPVMTAVLADYPGTAIGHADYVNLKFKLNGSPSYLLLTEFIG